LNFRYGIRRKSAHRLWRKWIAQLEKLEGHRLSWVRMAEIGETSGRLHFHAVVAGLVHTTPDAAKALWLAMAGDAHVKVLYSDNWLEYMLKEMEWTDDYDFDFELLPHHKREEHSTKGGMTIR
jgi:hypothetical protein